MFGVMAAQVAMQMVQASQQAKLASQQSVAQNKMIAAYNSKVMQSTMDQVTQINMQRAQQRQQTTAAMYNAGLQGQSARDQITLQAAATDTVGASVNDAVKTVNAKVGQAVGSAQDQYSRAIDQSNLMVTKLTGDGAASMKDAVDDKSTQIMNQAAWSAAGSVVGSLAGQAASSSNSSSDSITTTGSSSTGGSTDLWGKNSSSSGGSNPFGLSFKFESSNLLDK